MNPVKIPAAPIRQFASRFFILLLMLGLLLPGLHPAQAVPVAPAADAVCVVSALNRNATLIGDYYMIAGVPSLLGTYRIRAACSDGTVGQTGVVTPANGDVFTAGAIVWGSVSPIPRSLAMQGPGNVSYGQTVQMSVTATGMDGATWDVSNGKSGTNYVSSDPALARIGADGVLTVLAQAGAQSVGRQVVISATNEGTAVSRLVNIGPRGAIAGRVMLADGVTPAPGAQVTIQLAAPLTRFAVQVTDASGAFRVADAPAGNYTLSVLAPASGARGSAVGTLDTSGATASFDITLRGQGRVRVSVAGAGGPTAAAQVTVAHAQFAGEVRSAQTGADGVALIDGFSAGSFSVSVRAATGGALGTASGELAGGGVAEVAVQLQEAGTISGHVLQGGIAQTGVQVRLTSAAKGLVSQMMSGAGGLFRFDSLLLGDGPYLLQAYRNGQLQGSVGALVPGVGQELRQDMELGTFAAIVTGKVVDATGQRTPGADVVLLAAGQQFKTRTDAQGEYQFGSVPPGAFTVTATLGRLRASAEGVLLAGSASLTVDLRLAGDGEVSGRLLLSNGQIASGATVVLRHALTGTRQLVADANGEFNFGAVSTGSYVLDIVHDASGELARIPGGLAAAGDGRRYVLALTGLGTLRVKVTSAGVPAAGVRVALALRGTLAAGSETTTDANGFAEFTAVPRVDYGITASRGGAGAGEYVHAIGSLSAASKQVELALQSNGYRQFTVMGHVRDTQGRAVPDQWVRLSTRDVPGGSAFQAAWIEYLVRSDIAGNYRFENAFVEVTDLGNFKVDALIDGVLRGRATPTIMAEDEVLIQDVIVYDVGTVVGTVLSSKGGPVAAAAVTLAGFDAGLFTAGDFSVNADLDGHYAIPAPPRAYVVTAQAPDGSGAASLPRSLIGIGGAVAADFGLVTTAAYLKVHVDTIAATIRVSLSVDGRNYGNVAGEGNFAAIALAPGVHAVRLDADYGAVQTRDVTVREGDDSRIIEEAFNFNPARLSVSLQHAVPGARMTVLVDGATFGSGTTGTAVVGIVKPGTHDVTVATSEGERKTQQVTVTGEEAGKTIALAFAFNPAYLNVRVGAIDSNTVITINGTYADSGNGIWEHAVLGLKPGPNVVAATSNGVTKTVTVQVDANDDGRAYDVSFAFNMAWLQVRLENVTDTGSVKVSVDDRGAVTVVGHGTIPLLAVTQASHVVRGDAADGLSASTVVTVPPSDVMQTVEAVLSFVRPQLDVSVFNSAPQSVSTIRLNGKEIGRVTGSGALRSVGLQTGFNEVIAVTDAGDMQHTTFVLAELTNGLAREVNFVFDQLQATRATLGFEGERHLYSVAVKPGDRLGVSAHSGVLDGVAPITSLKTDVYDSALLLAASGNVAGQPFEYRWTSESGDFRAIPMAAGGFATVAVEASYASERGGYMVSAAVNGQPAPLLPYQGGGSVEGTVLGSDGMGAAGMQVALKATDLPALHVRASADQAGHYRFDGVPLGAVALSALVDGQVATSAAARLDTGAQVLVQDLRLPRVTTLQVSVTVGEGLAVPATLYVDLTDSTGSRKMGPLVFDGGRTSNTLTVSATGDSFTLSTVLPSDGTYMATQTFNAGNGGTVAVNLQLRAVQLNGRVLQGDGTGAANRSVSVLRAADMALIANVTTDEQGRYTLRLPGGDNLVVRVYDSRYQTYLSMPVAAGSGATITAPDLVLGGTGVVEGAVVYDSGAPLANATIEISGTVGGAAFTQYGSSGTDGRYRVEGIPAGVPLGVSATAGSMNVVQVQHTSITAAGQVVRVPDFVFASGTRLTIRLLDGDGRQSPLLTDARGECATYRVVVRTADGVIELRSEYMEPVTGIAPGPVDVAVYELCSDDDAVPLARATTIIGTGGDASLDVRVPILTGTMTYSDGRLVVYPNLVLTQAAAGGKVKTLTRIWNPDNDYASHYGKYVLVGVGLGDFTLTSRMGIAKEVVVNGTLSETANLTVDMVLPAPLYDGMTSDVVGRVLVDGVPAPDYNVVLFDANNWQQSVITNAEGVFQFVHVVAGSYTLSTSRNGLETIVQGVSGNAPLLSHDLALAAPPYDGLAFDLAGTVTVDGAAVAGVTVAAASAGDVATTLADDSGNYRFYGLPSGVYTLTARYGADHASAMVTGGTTPLAMLNLDIHAVPFDGSASLVRGTVSAEGVGISGAELTLARDGENLHATADYLGQFQFDRVLAGAFTLSARKDGRTASLTGSAGASPVVVVDLALPALVPGVKVSGVLRYNDGGAVLYPNVVLYQPGQTHYADVDDLGRYSVSGVQPGMFDLTAQDGDSGLSVSVSGSAAASDITRDVTLPPSGSVSGTARDAAGQPLADAWVYAQSSGAAEAFRYTATDAQGQYRFAQLALGIVQIGIQDSRSYFAANGSIVLNSNGQSLSLDLQLAGDAAAVAGHVYDANGTPLAGTAVWLSTEQVYGPVGPFTVGAVTDAQGGFRFDAVPPGRMRVGAFDDNGDLLVALDGTASLAGQLTMVLTGGMARTPYASLEGADGYRYDFSCPGSLQGGGFTNSPQYFPEFLALQIDAQPFPCVMATMASDDRRELTFGPVQMGAIRVTRRVFSPSSGGFVRVIDTFQNTGGSVITVKAAVGTAMIGRDMPLVIDPASTGQAYAVLDTPSLVQVFGGIGAAPQPSKSFVYQPGYMNDPRTARLGYGRSMTIGPGASVSLLHYSAQASDAAAARSMGSALSTNGVPAMFDNIDATLKTTIINFAVP